MEVVDYIIVGSGCTGAMAAATLCANGKQVVILDTGIEGNPTETNTNDFIKKRYHDQQQADFFLGKNLEALQAPTHANIPQQTAQRSFITKLTDTLLPIESTHFFPVESLALGGLGNGWGLGAYTFSANELKRVGLNEKEILNAYKLIADRIGISGETNDDASRFCHNNTIPLQPPLEINATANSLYQQYQKKKPLFSAKHISMGKPSLALLSADKDNRKSYAYNDLDFYSNEGNSAYRPNITIETLTHQGKLVYRKNWLVISFKEADYYTIVYCLNIVTKEKKEFFTKKLILAASTLSTARIILRSFNSDIKLPVLCNAYTYMPLLHWPHLGKQNIGRHCGLAQLAMFYDRFNNHEEVAMASIYNYRSLLNFRISKQLPLNYADGNKLLQLLMPALCIAGIFHPAAYQPQNFIRLHKADSITGDLLQAAYTYLGAEQENIHHTEKIYASAFSKLQCLVLKKMSTPTGASIHYAGTLPFSSKDELFHISPDGKLYGTNHVFIADGSGFSYLPGKGLTLTLMANAHNVALKTMQYE